MQREFASLCCRLQDRRFRYMELCRDLRRRLVPTGTKGPHRRVPEFPTYSFVVTAEGGCRMIRSPLFTGGSEDAGRGPGIRILVAASYALTRHAIRSVLEQESGIQTVGEAENREQAFEQAVAVKADIIVVMDSDDTGRSAIHLLDARGPLKVLMLRDGAAQEVSSSIMRSSGGGTYRTT